MKKVLMFSYLVLAYGIGFASLLLWILSISQLIPEISIDQNPTKPFFYASIKNLGLVTLLGVQYRVMAHQSFKNKFSKYFSKPIERSTFALITGLLITLLVFEWEPMGGLIWAIQKEHTAYYTSYALFFAGWIILFTSTFLTTHFDIFKVRQTYLELQNKPYTKLNFRVVSFHKNIPHPLYIAGIIGLWATPTMTITHLVFALSLTAYFIIGTLFAEYDLQSEFGETNIQFQS